MDPLTHGLVGQLVAKSIFPRREEKKLVTLITVTNLLPDLDGVITGNGLEYLQMHRGISHSLIGVLFGGAFIAWLSRYLGLQKVSFFRLYILSLFGLLLHIFFDLFNSYGTMLFLPFSNARISFDLLFILDPYLDLILIGGLFIGWCVGSGRAYCVGLILMGIYLAFAIVVTGAGYFQLDRWKRLDGIEIDRVAVLPTPFSPLHRRGIVVSGSKVYHVPLVFLSNETEDVTTFASALSDCRLESVWKMDEGAIYKWFARFPIVQTFSNKLLLIQDLQFLVPTDSLGWLGSLISWQLLKYNPDFFDRRIFYLEVGLDKKGGVYKVVFKRR